MARDRKDRSANWIIEHHGGSLLHLAKISNFTKWQAAPTVLTFPKQMPDGLLDVTFPDRPSADPFLIEIESYPERDTIEQIRADAAMVLLARGVLPDILLVVLSPKGNLSIAPEQVVRSAHGLCELRLRIHVVNMWMIPAADLLAANDVGLVPWIPLTDFKGAPESILQQCKERIEAQAAPSEKANLLAATRVMAEMRYNDAQLLNLLGGLPMSMEKVYLASRSVQFFMAKTARETTRKHIFHQLEKRFGPAPEDLAAHLRAIDDQQKLDELLDAAIDCGDLNAFREALLESS